MQLDLSPQSPPLRVDESGVVRIGRTRIPIERVVYAYNHGESPEQIVDSFDTLALSDVYTLIGYYLRYRAEVDAYAEQRERRAEEVRRENEARFPPDGIRERLLARRAASKPAP